MANTDDERINDAIRRAAGRIRPLSDAEIVAAAKFMLDTGSTWQAAQDHVRSEADRAAQVAQHQPTMDEIIRRAAGRSQPQQATEFTDAQLAAIEKYMKLGETYESARNLVVSATQPQQPQTAADIDTEIRRRAGRL